MKIFVVFVFLLPTLVFADDIFDVAEKYNNKKKTVITLESEKREMLSEIYDLERKTKKIYRFLYGYFKVLFKVVFVD